MSAAWPLEFRTWIMRNSFEQIRDKLSHEVRLDQSNSSLGASARFFADEPQVHIPALLNIARRGSQPWSGSPVAK